MDTTQIILAIITFIVVAIVAFFIYFSYKKSQEGKEEATKFLNGLKEALYEKLFDIIKNFDYKDYDNLVGVELEIIKQMTKTAKDYITVELVKSSSLLSALALKALSDEFISKFVDFIINRIDLDKTIENQLGDRYKEFSDVISSEEKELDKQYNNNELYYLEENDVIKLPEAKEEELLEEDKDGLEIRGFVKPNKEEESKLNPQVEEEENFNPEDESMELITEETTYVDNRGRLHDKSTGRYVKLNLDQEEDNIEE